MREYTMVPAQGKAGGASVRRRMRSRNARTERACCDGRSRTNQTSTLNTPEQSSRKQKRWMTQVFHTVPPSPLPARAVEPARKRATDESPPLR